MKERRHKQKKEGNERKNGRNEEKKLMETEENEERKKKIVEKEKRIKKERMGKILLPLELSLEHSAPQEPTVDISRTAQSAPLAPVALRIIARLLLKWASSGNDQMTVGLLSGVYLIPEASKQQNFQTNLFTPEHGYRFQRSYNALPRSARHVMCRFSAYWYEAAHGAKSSTTSSLRVHDVIARQRANKQKNEQTEAEEKSTTERQKQTRSMNYHRPGTEEVISLASCQVPFWHVYHFWMRHRGVRLQMRSCRRPRKNEKK
jgi:hypothetical protein